MLMLINYHLGMVGWLHSCCFCVSGQVGGNWTYSESTAVGNITKATVEEKECCSGGTAEANYHNSKLTHHQRLHRFIWSSNAPPSKIQLSNSTLRCIFTQTNYPNPNVWASIIPSNYSSSYTSPPPNNPIIIIHAQPPVPHPHFSLIWLLLHHTLGPPQLVTHIPHPHILFKPHTVTHRCTLPSFHRALLCSLLALLPPAHAANHQSHPQGGLPRCNLGGNII